MEQKTTTFPVLDYQHIKVRFPKSVERIKEWLFNQKWMSELAVEQFGTENIPKEAKEHATGLIIQMDPRKLYDIFDIFEIFISIKYDNGMFWSEVKSQHLQNISSTSKNRIRAEQTAFEDAFEVLEKQL